MFTMAFPFRPWTNPETLSPGKWIKQYLEDTAKEEGILKNIYFNHKIKKASWDSNEKTWTVEVENQETFKANFLFCCAGYYRYDKGYTPDFPGVNQFEGTLIHPQNWPEDFDYSGKNIVVIGSGATAVTLIPNLAKTAKHVTMLQRTPVYMLSKPRISFGFLKKILPIKWWFKLIRYFNALGLISFYRLSQKYPEKVKNYLLAEIKKVIGDKFDPKDFTPPYNVWDQRVCVVSDNDFFLAIRDGRASIATDWKRAECRCDHHCDRIYLANFRGN
jgi:cation diffusion facilitator CzcD-associated flavoprotein CzcO